MNYSTLGREWRVSVIAAVWVCLASPVICASGTEEQVGFREDFDAADLVAITFYKNISRTEVSCRIEITDPDEIDNFLADLKGLTAQCYKCGYDGAVDFLNKGQSIGGSDFNLGCGQMVTSKGCVDMDAALLSRMKGYRAKGSTSTEQTSD